MSEISSPSTSSPFPPSAYAFVLVVLTHHRRRVVHFNVTEHPTARWTAQQSVNAFPDDSAPSYLLHDRDQVYGEEFRRRVKGLRIEEVLTAPHSPWQNPFAERLIGSLYLPENLAPTGQGRRPEDADTSDLIPVSRSSNLSHDCGHPSSEPDTVLAKDRREAHIPDGR
jgi:transposase InsO family protein